MRPVVDAGFLLLVLQLFLQLFLCHGRLEDQLAGCLAASNTKKKDDDSGDSSCGGGLVWQDLEIWSCDATNIVRHNSGLVRNGQLTGLLGPSGSGKSTLLSAFAGMCPLDVEGEIRAFSVTSSHQKGFELRSVPTKQVAWLQQQDDFFTQLTVQETLGLAAFLELPDVSSEQRELLVIQTASQLGLAHALDRPIGDAGEAATSSVSRLSGGERRRLSVALELLTGQQQLLLADEPTSGQDSSYSATVMKLLKDLAVSRNIPAICSLHQPRSSIWRSLDSVILMAPRGRVVYVGDRQDCLTYFERLGYTLPAHTNPAEFLIDLVSVDSEDNVQAEKDLERVEKLEVSFRQYQAQHWAQHRQSSESSITILDASTTTGLPQTRSRFHMFRCIPRFGALLQRSWRQNVRDVGLTAARVLLNAGNAFLLAGIFPSVQGSIPYVNSIADRVALLSFGAINLCMIAYMKAVTLFAKERPIVRREQTREQYSVVEYLLAKVVAEMPMDAAFSAIFTTVLKRRSGLQISWKTLTCIFSLLTTAGASLGFLLGSLVPSDQHATTAGVPLLVLLMVVGVINPSGVDLSRPPPVLLRVLKSVSPFASAIEALILGEYPGVQFQSQGGDGFFSRLKNAPRMGGLALVSTGDQVVEALGLKKQTYIGAMKHLAILSMGNLVVSWIGLAYQQRQRRLRAGKQSLRSKVRNGNSDSHWRVHTSFNSIR